MPSDFQIEPELLDIYRLEAEAHLAAITGRLAELRANGADLTALQDLRRRVHTLKGAAASIGMLMVAGLAHRMEDLLDKAQDRKTPITPETLSVLSMAAKVLESVNHEGSDDSIDLRDLNARLDKIVASGSGSDRHETGGRTPASPDIRPVSIGAGERTPARVVRVSWPHLEKLTRLVSELSTNREKVDQSKAGILDEIQTTLVTMRLLPLRMLVPRLRRIVRTAADQEKKKVVLLLEGESLQLDTTTIEQIVDPLMHLLRNAVGHGIESPDVRRRSGKPEQGSVHLRAFRDGSDIVIEVQDDGIGLDLAAIREHAVRQNLITAAQANSLGDDDLCRFVLFPGFSTASSISQVSGRGVGLDVVQEAIRRLHGSIVLESRPGNGTIVRLRLPAHPLVQASKATAPARSEGPVLNVMIVDDSPSMRRINAALIRKAGWIAITATDGLDALDKLERSEKVPDAILLDVEMPRMDGFGVLRRIRNHEAYRDITVIMLTSRTTRHHRDKAEELAVSEYLTKPCRGDVLIGHIRRLQQERNV